MSGVRGAERPSLRREALTMLGGLLVWGAHLTIVYAATALACARPRLGDAVLGLPLETAAVAGATVLALTAITACGFLAARRRAAPEAATAPSAFSGWVGVALAVLAFVGVLWTASTPLLVPPCR
jgi:hypothetical protein